MSSTSGAGPVARKPKRHLPPSEKYELWVSVLTGQATHADTIQAVNDAHIDNYLEKPWDPAVLLTTARKLLTRFIMEKGIDHTPYMSCLDQATLLDYLRRN